MIQVGDSIRFFRKVSGTTGIPYYVDKIESDGRLHLSWFGGR